MLNRFGRIGLFVAVSAAMVSPAHAGDMYRVSGAEVVVVCPLTVGGSFEARTKTVRGEVAASPDQAGAMTGALHVDLETLETGIGIRDRHMRNNYLEVQKGEGFAVATIEDIRIEKLEGKTTFKGTLKLHGQRKEVSGTAELKQQDGRVRVQAQFPIRVSEFAIPEPTYLGVGVKDEIVVKVSMTAAPVPTQTARAR
jgi:polyisoprenoid-binding protein YceI